MRARSFLLVLVALIACGDDGPGNLDLGAGPADLGADLGSDLGAGDGVVTIAANTVLTGSQREWTADNVYVLEGPVFVGDARTLIADADRTTLRIEPGTEIRGVRGNLDATAGPLRLPGVLVVTRSGRIDAEGTPDRPIVFTSNRPAGQRISSDWGGVVLLGRGTNNVPGGTDFVEGLVPSANSTYGAAREDRVAAWDCGTMRYVRIEFAGFEVEATRELNGLTVGSCGSDTVLDNIHVHRGSDDGIEFFGGSANATRLILTGNQDDSVDWDEGYDAAASSRWNSVDSVVETGEAVSPDRGVEGDGLPTGVESLGLASNPTLFNVTFVGSPAGESTEGFELRDGTKVTVRNAVIAGFPGGAIDIGDQGAAMNATAEPSEIVVTNTVFQGAPGVPGVFPDDDDDDPDGDGGPAPAVDETTFFTGEGSDNQVIPLSESVIADPSLTAPDFALGFTPTIAPARPPDDGFFDPTATFIGAIGGGEDFTRWTTYPEN